MTDQGPGNDGQGRLPAVSASSAAGEKLRVSHADRDQAAELLRVAAGDGRISPEELDDRLERALTATTYADLTAVTADLPGASGFAGPPVAASAAPKDLVRIHVQSSSTRRDGRWVVPRELDVRVDSGSVTLDFTEAVITHPVLRVTAEVKSGSLTLITRPGIVVDEDDVSTDSGRIKLSPQPDSGVPVALRIELAGSVHSGRISARPPRPPRRSFWQWLRRAPRPPAISAPPL